MHPEVVDNEAGKCPICGMALETLRLALVWTCTVHGDVTRMLAGTCPRCGRDLIRVTKALSFTCPVHTSVVTLDPGRCPRCRRTLVAKTYTVRPHGDHNPKHGGSFFMVSNNWHLEVTHPAAAVFRLYVYDNYSKPFAPPRADRADHAGARRRGQAGGPRDPVHALRARVLRGARAEHRGARRDRGEGAVRSRRQGYQFDFMFSDYSKEPLVTTPEVINSVLRLTRGRAQCSVGRIRKGRTNSPVHRGCAP